MSPVELIRSMHVAVSKSSANYLSDNKLVLQCITVHCGVEGNKEAIIFGSVPEYPLPRTMYKRILKNALPSWNSYWKPNNNKAIGKL